MRLRRGTEEAWAGGQIVRSNITPTSASSRQSQILTVYHDANEARKSMWSMICKGLVSQRQQSHRGHEEEAGGCWKVPGYIFFLAAGARFSYSFAVGGRTKVTN